MVEPGIRAALGAGWRAAAGSAWLAPVGLLVALVRGGLALPALAFAAWAVSSGAAGGLARHGPSPAAALGGALAAAGTPRFAAVALGLWLSSALLGGALRAAYLAGALPTLGRTLSGSRAPSREFAAGVAWRFPRVAGTALLAFGLELGGRGLWLAAAAAGLLAIPHVLRGGGPVAAAALVAAALTSAMGLRFAASCVADAAVARAALADERPLRALAGGMRRLARRPAAFLACAGAAALLDLLLSGSLRAAGDLALGFARSASALLLLGPQAMVAVLGALVSALVELWRLGALAVLACGAPPRRA